MRIETSEYFICKSDHGIGDVFVPKVAWNNKFVKVIKKHNITGFRLPDTLSWDYENLDFLYQLEGFPLLDLEIYHLLVKDISLMALFPNLEVIGITSPFTTGPDFSVFKNLKVALVTWRPKLAELLNCENLEYVNIEKYPYADLQPLEHLQKLKRLLLTSGKLISLSGVEELNAIELIDLYNCPKLQSISGIEQCQKLSLVELERCKLITDVSEYGSLVKHITS